MPCLRVSPRSRYLSALIVGALHGESKTRLLSPLFAPDGAESLWEGESALCREVEEVARGSFWRCEPVGDAFAPRSLEAALWAFAHSVTFAEGALMVANLGGDADTTAAIYGQARHHTPPRSASHPGTLPCVHLPTNPPAQSLVYLPANPPIHHTRQATRPPTHSRPPYHLRPPTELLTCPRLARVSSCGHLVPSISPSIHPLSHPAYPLTSQPISPLAPHALSSSPTHLPARPALGAAQGNHHTLPSTPYYCEALPHAHTPIPHSHYTTATHR